MALVPLIGLTPFLISNLLRLNNIIEKKFQKTVKNINPEQMKIFHQNHYIAKNCTLSIPGKVPKEINYKINNNKVSLIKGLFSLNMAYWLYLMIYPL